MGDQVKMQPLLRAICQHQRQMWEMPVPLSLAPRCHRPWALCHTGLYTFPFHTQKPLCRETRRLGEVRQRAGTGPNTQYLLPGLGGGCQLWGEDLGHRRGVGTL